MPTASVTSPASSSIWTTWSGSGSTASGSRLSRSRRTRTGATTSRTSVPSLPSSARWTISTDSSPRQAERGIRVLMDMVPNHTSDQHPWFLESRSSRRSAHRDWYVWADGAAGGGPPNNWVSSFGGPGWTFDETTGQYYFHNHLAEQPDLNWWNDEVRDAFDSIFRFWSDRGVAGFRIDVCNVIIKDAELRDNPPATEDDDFETQMFGQRSVYNANRPEVHDVIRRWRCLADGYDEPRLLIGETPVPLDRLAEFYGDGHDELGLAFNFDFIGAPLDARAMRDIVERTEAALPPGGMAGVDRLQPRHVPLPHPLGGGRPPQGSRCAPDAAQPAWHPGALSGRRDRDGQRHRRSRRPARPARGALLPVLRGARRWADPDAVEQRARRRLHRRPPSLAPPRRRGGGQRGRSSGTIRTRS